MICIDLRSSAVICDHLRSSAVSRQTDPKLPQYFINANTVVPLMNEDLFLFGQTRLGGRTRRASDCSITVQSTTPRRGAAVQRLWASRSNARLQAV